MRDQAQGRPPPGTRFRHLVLCLVLSVCASASTASAITYTTLDHPQAGNGGTVAYDIDGNRIVGTYRDVAGASHAFTYDGGTWATLDHPNAVAPRGTTAFGVSDGVMTGTYVDAAGQTFGYLYDGVTWTTLAHPPSGLGRADTFARGVSGGTVVGYYIESGVTRGFVYQGGTFTDLIVPTAIGTLPDDIDDGRIVGTVEDPVGSHGFLLFGPVPVVLDHPLGPLGTFASGIDGTDVVGSYLTLPTGRSRGFLFNGIDYLAIDFPGATDTTVQGIDGIRVVGSYVDPAGRTHGFVGTIPEPSALAAITAAGWWLLARRPRRPHRG